MRLTTDTVATHPEYRALIAAVLADPAADLPRLVVADWLDERGDHSLAEFIRVQVEFARRGCSHVGPLPVPGCDRCRLRVRERVLQGGGGAGPDERPAHLRAWFGGSLGFAESFVTARGFVSGVWLPVAAFMGHARAIFSEHPVERVWLSDLRPNADDDPGDLGVWTRVRARDRAYPSADGAALRYGLPNRLFDRLAGGDRGPDMAVYESEEAAWADLSAACVAFGRDLAGLANPAGG